MPLLGYVESTQALAHVGSSRIVVYTVASGIEPSTSCPTVRYSTVRCGTVQYGIVRYRTVKYGTLRYSTVRYIILRVRYVTLC